MNFNETDWRSKVLYQSLLFHFDGHRQWTVEGRVRVIKKAIKHFRRNYQEEKLIFDDVILAARKLWEPKSRVRSSWYYRVNTAKRAAAGCSMSRVIGNPMTIATWCNDYSMTKTAMAEIKENNDYWLKKLGLGF